MKKAALAVASTALSFTLMPALVSADEAKFPTPLEAEPIPAIETLPKDYPDSWMIVHDFNFNSMVDGRFNVIDISGEGHGLKGTVPASHFAHMLAPKKAKEIYVAETYYTRMVRGERNDVITIYDRDTLAFKDEILLPDGKRAQMIELPNTFQLTNDEKWALVFNFTPASSVRIVDIEARKILNEIDIPGCMLTFPTGSRGFSTMCSDGGMTAISLGKDGKVEKQESIPAFNDIDNDPLFMFATQGSQLTHFVSYSGDLQTIDFSGDVPSVKERWSLLDDSTQSWRPGGWQIISSDEQGQIYVLMHPDGFEGSHKNGGSEVWVVSPSKRKVLKRIELKNEAWSIGVSAGKEPMLVAASLAGFMDVYDVKSGSFLRQLEQTVAYNPVAMFPAP
ncbi:MAG: amine dehydrogenase large subunit [Pseudomonadota bacterium]